MARGGGYLTVAGLLVCVVALGFVIAGTALGAGVVDIPDRAIFSALALQKGVAPDWQISIAHWLSWFGDTERRTILIAVCALWLLWERRYKAALVMAVVPPLGAALSSLLKESFARPRPDIVPHLDVVTNLSYPSGHAAGGAGLLIAAMIIPSTYRSAWVGAALILMIFIGMSRPMLGVHWPSDILGGWLLGFAVAIFGVSLTRSLEAR
jgi:undecaprenyl-diphosphatase